MSAYPGTHARLPEPASQRTALLALGAVLLMTLLFVVVSLQFLFPSPRTAPRWQALGLESSFALASVTHIPEARVLLIRHQDGSFVAYADRDDYVLSWGADLRHCKLDVMHSSTQFDYPAAVPGFDSRGLRDSCFINVYRMDGERIFGPASKDLTPSRIRLRDGYVELNVEKGPWLPRWY